jgi:hypothetical protein
MTEATRTLGAGKIMSSASTLLGSGTAFKREVAVGDAIEIVRA